MLPSSSTIPCSLALLLFLLLPLLHISSLSDSNLTEIPEIKISSSDSANNTASKVLIRGNATILSENNTFILGFLSSSGGPNGYLGIWFASIPTPTFVWVANRENPVKNFTSSTLEITETGNLAVKDSGESIVWQSTNTELGTEMKFLENGNLILLNEKGEMVYQSFDSPSDTWLPGMNITTVKFLTSWRSLSDPSPGFYSLRLNPQNYGECELVFNNSKPYWNTGNWTGESFDNVPEMRVPYIYQFIFTDPFKPTASFGFTERQLDNGLPPLLTRFQMDCFGQLRQYTWTPQTDNWNMFWSQPEDRCRVYGLCGKFGVCSNRRMPERPCDCLSWFSPVDSLGWDSGDFSGGCRWNGGDLCDRDDKFEKVSGLGFEGADVESVSTNSNWDLCEKSCLGSCSCIGLYFDEQRKLCKNFNGSLLNLQNSSFGSSEAEEFYVKVPIEGSMTLKKKKKNALNLSSAVLTVIIVGLVFIFGVLGLLLFVLLSRRQRREGVEEESFFPVLNLKMFSYKDLYMATRAFSEKLGHGGFGTVFRGELSDSDSTIVVAVKRLERPGSGEKEFRAEVCTLGNIQHVNLVRLRGFCAENSHRLLVYDYMPNGPLSTYLRREGLSLSWDSRFRVAVGTARGIAYLHEECRDCIIHCDIKPENILLDSDFTAKVSDFGLAKLMGREFSRVLATMRGTWGYVAPEWISGLAITTKADVYSYGMTLLELLGGRRNVEAGPTSGEDQGGVAREKWFFPCWAACQIIEGNVGAVVDDRLGGVYNILEVERVGLVAVWCIQDEEGMRPEMGMVVKMLEGVLEVSVPPAPKLLQALVSGESFYGVKTHSGDDRMVLSGCSGSHENIGGLSFSSQSCHDNVTFPVNE